MTNNGRHSLFSRLLCVGFTLFTIYHIYRDMSEPISDADKIRNKRLAKLSQPQSQDNSMIGTSQTAPEQANPAVESKDSASTISISKVPEPEPAISDDHSTTGPQVNGGVSRIRITPKPALESIQVTPQKHYLDGLCQEIQDGEDGKEVRMRIDLLEQAIMEAGSQALVGRSTPIDYLFGCWKRVSRLSKGFKDRGPENQKWVIVQEARRLCMSWCIFAITTPEIFGKEYDGTKRLAEHLI